MMKAKSISPMQVFQQMDENKDNSLSPVEFLDAMRKLKVDFSTHDVDILFRYSSSFSCRRYVSWVDIYC